MVPCTRDLAWKTQTVKGYNDNYTCQNQGLYIEKSYRIKPVLYRKISLYSLSAFHISRVRFLVREKGMKACYDMVVQFGFFTLKIAEFLA